RLNVGHRIVEGRCIRKIEKLPAELQPQPLLDLEIAHGEGIPIETPGTVEDIPPTIPVRECRGQGKRRRIEPEVNVRTGESSARQAIRPLAISRVRRIRSNTRRKRGVRLPGDNAARLPSLRDASDQIVTARSKGDRVNHTRHPALPLIVIRW